MWAIFLALKELANPSVNLIVGLAMVLKLKPETPIVPTPNASALAFCELHCRNATGAAFTVVTPPMHPRPLTQLAMVPTVVIRPFCTYATICCGLLIDNEVLPLTELCAWLEFVVNVELTPRN